MNASQRVLVSVILLLSMFTLSCPANATDIDAELGWAGLHTVNFPFDGGVIRVHVYPGDRVSKGEKLVELNQEPIEIKIRQYTAELDARAPVLADAKRDYEHAKSLYEQTVLSDVELQRSQHAYEKASAELAAARARLDYALWQRKQTVATAPFDARVVARKVEPGQMLVAEQRSRPLLVLARADRMTARALLPASSLRSLATGQPVKVLVEDAEFAATVISLGKRPDGADGSANYLLEAEFRPGPENLLRAGQAAKVRLP